MPQNRYHVLYLSTEEEVALQSMPTTDTHHMTARALIRKGLIHEVGTDINERGHESPVYDLTEQGTMVLFQLEEEEQVEREEMESVASPLFKGSYD